jgi:hypothetical protein
MNPKDAVGRSKAPISTVPLPWLHSVGVAMFEGELKYGKHNFRSITVTASVYYDAAMRHLNAWYEGEDIDPDSGVSHLAKASACLAIIHDCFLRKDIVDDRPSPSPPGWLQELNDQARALREKYENQ